jgi:hypothetical protein
MITAPTTDRPAQVRWCAVTGRLGHLVECPPGGCALLHALGEQLPSDPRTPCRVERFAHGDNRFVIRTLDELRREMQGERAAARARTAKSKRVARHAAILRRWNVS